MCLRARKTNTCSFSLNEIESLDLSHSLGISRETSKLERRHCIKGREILKADLVVDFNVNWPQIRITCREPHLKKCPDCLEAAGRPSQMQRVRQG